VIFRVLKRIFCAFLAVLLGGSLVAFRANALPLSLPSVSARSAILLCAENGSVFFEKNADERLGPASTTKLMTALTVLSLVEDPDAAVTIPREAVGIEGSSIYLVAGETLTVRELLWALLLSSANDAATALAIFSAGSVENFCVRMNALADEWGLQNTHFSNPHGLSADDHYTTARDLVSIARRVLDDPLLSGIVATYKKTIPMDGTPDARLLVNHNRLLRTYEGAIGMKTGFTKATGRTLVSAAERGGMTLIAVTLNAPDDWRDHTAMLDFGFASYECVTLGANSFSYEMPVVGGVSESVTLANAEPISMILPKSREAISSRVEAVSRFAYAPVSEGDSLATLTLTCEGETASTDLVATESVVAKMPEKQGFFARILNFFREK